MSAISKEHQAVCASTEADNDNRTFLCELVGKTAIMTMIARQRRNGGVSTLFSKKLESLHRELEIVHRKLFKKLQDPNPRGAHMDSWKEVQILLNDSNISTRDSISNTDCTSNVANREGPQAKLIDKAASRSSKISGFFQTSRTESTKVSRGKEQPPSHKPPLEPAGSPYLEYEQE